MGHQKVRYGYVSEETYQNYHSFRLQLDGLSEYGILCEDYLYDKGERGVPDLSTRTLTIALMEKQDGYFRFKAKIPLSRILSERIDEKSNCTVIEYGVNNAPKSK